MRLIREMLMLHVNAGEVKAVASLLPSSLRGSRSAVISSERGKPANEILLPGNMISILGSAGASR